MLNFIKRHKIAAGILAVVVIIILFSGGSEDKDKVSVDTSRVKEMVDRQGDSDQISPASASRSFYMGFTPAEYDATPGALEVTYRFIGKNADLITHHFVEGVPWQEALEQKRYHANVESNLSTRVQKINEKQKRFLCLSPLKPLGGLGGYWGEESNMERTGKWKDKELDDGEVITAYTNFSRDLIKRLKPDFMAYTVEANMILVETPELWPRYVTFARQVYARLKAEYPTLPIFVSLQIDEYWADEKEQGEAIKQILPYTDYIAISTYPYSQGFFDPSAIPKDYFEKIARLAPDKPFAVAETGFIAEDIDALGVIKGRGTEKGQGDYLSLLLWESNRLNARFVSWFVPIDYDAYFEVVKSLNNPQLTEFFKVWRDNGLFDGSGNPRQAYFTWLSWLKTPKR